MHRRSTPPDPTEDPVDVGTAPDDQPRFGFGSAAWAIAAAFGAYFCMYGFRKPFTSAAYEGLAVWGLTFKSALVTSQVAGYTLSKFIGIKVVSEMPANRRAASILGLIVFAEVALVLFGAVPAPWNAAFLFLNGLPLGMVFGLVVGFLEGRRLTEVLVAGLCASFILADGVVKSVGAWLLAAGVGEFWMPSVAGAIFLAPLAVCVWMLTRVPPPGEADIAQRSARRPLRHTERWGLYRRYAGGLTCLVLLYLAVTILRSIRADFAPEIWRGLGAPAAPETFGLSELCVALGVIAINGSSAWIKDNRRAFFTSLGACALGIALLVVALLAWQAEWIAAFPFMVAIGLGLYVPYVAIHTTIFERLLAMTRDVGTIGFLLYVADAFGYLGYVAVMLVRGRATVVGDSAQFFLVACWVAAGFSLLCVAGSWLYFARIARRDDAAARAAAEAQP